MGWSYRVQLSFEHYKCYKAHEDCYGYKADVSQHLSRQITCNTVTKFLQQRRALRRNVTKLKWDLRAHSETRMDKILTRFMEIVTIWGGEEGGTEIIKNNRRGKTKKSAFDDEVT